MARGRPGAAPAAPEAVRVRGRVYERGGDASPLAPRPVARRSRTRASEVTFGLRGRLACTAALVLPTALLLARGTLFWLFSTVASWVLAAVALPEVWRAVDAVEPAEPGGRPPSTR